MTSEERDAWEALVPGMGPDEWIRFHGEKSCAAAARYAYALHDARGEFHAGGNYDDAVRAFKADLAVMLRTLCGAALAGYRP